MLESFLSDLAIYFASFLAVGGTAYLALWVWGRERFAHRRIQPKRRASKSFIRREFLWCVSTFFIFTAGDTYVEYLKFSGRTRMYDAISDYGWSYLVGSTIFMIVAHDAYFYWSHRIFHQPFFFRHVHYVHHQATDPSPFTSFNFHPIEAFFQWLVSFLFVMAFPVHFSALAAFQGWMTVMNVIGHMGYELYPASLPRRPVLGLFNTSTQHNLHHQKMQGNYGLYFSWWDRICGTERKDYLSEYDKVQKRIALAPTD